MKVLSLLSLLLALVLVAVLARKQLGELAGAHPPASSAAAVAASATGVALPRMDSEEEIRRVPQRVQDDVNRMMQDSASQVERAIDGAEKP